MLMRQILRNKASPAQPSQTVEVMLPNGKYLNKF